jgi:anthranilate phosphoribosyltransferase
MENLIRHLNAGGDLDHNQVGEVAELLLVQDGEVGPKARLLEALSLKGETPAEIAGFVEAFLRHAVDPCIGDLGLGAPTIDVCGTGGDKLNLFNVSTTAMFVVAGAGATVVKHGNRGITSKSGGADVLEALGVRIDHGPEGLRRCLTTAGVGFLFAPAYHPAFRAVAPVRAELAQRGVRTIFNLIGPLLNPGRPECQLVGVFERSLVRAFAEILERLGRASAWAVHGSTLDGRSVDEVSLMGATQICRAGRRSGRVEEEVTPQDVGLQLARVEDLQGGDAACNARILEAILTGEERGARRDMVLLNSAAALACCGLAEDIAGGLVLAAEAIDSGEAHGRLRQLREIQQ